MNFLPPGHIIFSLYMPRTISLPNNKKNAYRATQPEQRSPCMMVLTACLPPYWPSRSAPCPKENPTKVLLLLVQHFNTKKAHRFDSSLADIAAAHYHSPCYIYTHWQMWPPFIESLIVTDG